MSYNIPILFLIFNRPDVTKKVFEAIRKAKPRQLFIGADGYRSSKKGEKELCEQTRKIIEKVDWKCEVKTLFQKKNLGCRKGVSTAINWFFKHIEYGIILEDDCLPNKSFFKFQKEMLEKYKDDSRIMMVSGNNFQNDIKHGKASYYFSRLAHIWGWGTWRRAWKLYDAEMETFEKFKKEKHIENIWEDKEVQKTWMKTFQAVADNKIDTWDYQWAFTIMKNNGLSIMPNVNLISNIGFGEGATHTTSVESQLANMKVSSLGKIIHPEFILANKKADLYTHINIIRVKFKKLKRILFKKYKRK